MSSRTAACLASLTFALLAPALGCINTDTAVFVDPSLGDATAAFTSSPFGGGSVTGGTVTLTLHLGARASGSSQVTLGELSILDAEKKGSLVSPLDATPSKPFPVTVEPDSDVDVVLDFTSGKAVLSDDVKAKLCDPAGIVVGGTIEDSLVEGTHTPVYSPVFHLSGC